MRSCATKSPRPKMSTPFSGGADVAASRVDSGPCIDQPVTISPKHTTPGKPDSKNVVLGEDPEDESIVEGDEDDDDPQFNNPDNQQNQDQEDDPAGGRGTTS